MLVMVLGFSGMVFAPQLLKLVLNGVKQGGIISPILFCVYIDDLLLLLAQSEVGCFIGNWFNRALAYADDIVLLAPIQIFYSP